MTLPKLGISLLLGLIAAWGMIWFCSQAASHETSEHPPEEGVPYAIDVTSDRSKFDLSFADGERYYLVLSSLGLASRTYELSLECEAVPEITAFSAQRLEGISPARASVPKGRHCRPEPSPAHSATTSVASSRMTCHQHDSTTVQSQVFVETLARQSGSDAGRFSDPTAVKTFYLHVTDGSLDDKKQYAKVLSSLVGKGRNVRIYLDQQLDTRQLAPGLVGEIVRLFDEEIIPITSRSLGRYRDVDGDESFTVLLSPWLDRLQGGRTSLGGFTRGSDFRLDIPEPFSNHCDMLYLNPNLRPGPHLKTLLAHEYAHAVCFSERLPGEFDCDGLPDEEDWLNEAIAHCAENLCDSGWSNIDYRVSRFLNQPEKYPLVVPDYYRAGLWRDHGCRGATYLFLRWCVDQFGDELLTKLIQNPKRGKEGLELATGRKFHDLYRYWNLALILPQCAPTESQDRRMHSVGVAPLRFGAYDSLDPYGRLSSWGLAGPRTETWDVNSGARAFVLKGTATVFLELRGAAGPGARRIHLRGEPGSAIQATLVKLPADRPDLDASAVWSVAQNSTTNFSSDVDANSVSAFNSQLHVSVTTDPKSTFTIDAVSCEWNFGETKQAYYFASRDLANFEDRHKPFEKTGERSCRRCFCFPVENPRDAEAGMVVKISARDKRGRRVTSWKTLPCHAELQMQANAEQGARTLTQ